MFFYWEPRPNEELRARPAHLAHRGQRVARQDALDHRCRTDAGFDQDRDSAIVPQAALVAGSVPAADYHAARRTL